MKQKTDEIKKNYNKYTSDFKVKVINHAKNSGNIPQIARENNVDESTVRYWVAEEKSIKKALAKTFCRSKDLKVHEQLTHLSVNVCPNSRSDNHPSSGEKSDDMKVRTENVSTSEKPQELALNIVKNDKHIYNKYTLEFKLEVINHAKKSGNITQTARDYNIIGAQTQIKYWVAKGQLISKANFKVFI
jgi:transposase-like protein